MIAQGTRCKDTNLLCHSIFIISRLFQINQHYILGFQKKDSTVSVKENRIKGGIQ